MSTTRTCQFALGLTIAACLMGCQDDKTTGQDAATRKDAADVGRQPDAIADVRTPDAKQPSDSSVVEAPLDVTTPDLRAPADTETPPDAGADGLAPGLDSSMDEVDAPASDTAVDVAMGDAPVDRRTTGEVALDAGPVCVNGTQETCASPGNPLLGACRAGVRACSGGAWGPCSEVLPAASESCNGVDDNCNGMIDEGCAASCIVVCGKCASSGDATADGSVAHPFATIEAALSSAGQNDGGTQRRICVVGGTTCKESTLYPMSGPLKMTDGLIIQGAYAITETGLEYCGVPTVRPRTTLAFAASEGVIFDQAVAAGAELSSMVIEINPPSGTESPAATGTAVAIKGGKNVTLSRVFVTEGFAATNTYGVAITSGGQATITESSISSGQGRAAAVGVLVDGGTLNMRDNCDKIVDGRCASYCDDGGAMLGAHGHSWPSSAEAAAQSSAVFVTGSSSASLVGNMFCGGTSNLADGQSVATVGTVRCEGAGCTTVSNNIIAGGTGPTAVGVALVGSSPRVDSNLIEGGCGDSASTGVWLESSSSRLQNNVIFGGQCPGAGTPLFCGVHLVSTGTSDNPDLHSNDIEPLGLAGDCQSIGVLVERTAGGTGVTAGVLRNNVLSAGVCNHGFAISEGAGASLQSVRNNDLYAPATTAASRTVVLYRHGNTDATTAAQVNAISLAGGNISADPGYASYPRDLHLTAASPCIDQGTAADAPATDTEGNARPVGLGPDIGAYEVRE